MRHHYCLDGVLFCGRRIVNSQNGNPSRIARRNVVYLFNRCRLSLGRGYNSPGPQRMGHKIGYHGSLSIHPPSHLQRVNLFSHGSFGVVAVFLVASGFGNTAVFVLVVARTKGGAVHVGKIWGRVPRVHGKNRAIFSFDEGFERRIRLNCWQKPTRRFWKSANTKRDNFSPVICNFRFAVVIFESGMQLNPLYLRRLY